MSHFSFLQILSNRHISGGPPPDLSGPPPSGEFPPSGAYEVYHGLVCALASGFFCDSQDSYVTKFCSDPFGEYPEADPYSGGYEPTASAQVSRDLLI